MSKNIVLRSFNSEELIFDEDETKAILRFFFKSKSELVEKLVVDDRVRGFSQGLLLEAIDASSALGTIHIVFTSNVNPSLGMRNIILKLGKNSAKHWYKNQSSELIRKKIYESVRKQLELSFSTTFMMHVNGIAGNIKAYSAFLAYAPSSSVELIWS